jgi:hypothetical protein
VDKERRTGPTLPCDGVFQPLGGLESSTSDAPCHRLVRPARVSSFQTARTASTTLPSRNAAFTTQSAFHQQVPLRACLRRTQRSPPPFSRSCLLRAGFRRSTSLSRERPSVPRLRGSPSSIRQKAALPAARDSRPGRSADRIHRLSTSAIATVLEHDSGHDRHPASFTGGCPPASLLCGQRRVFRRVAGRAIPGSGADVRFAAPAAPPSARSVGALPRPRTARTPQVTNPCPRRAEKPGAEFMEHSPHELAGGQREAIRARAALPNLPRRRSGSAHPRCLSFMGSPEGLAR